MISEILLWFIAFCMILGAEMVLSTVYLLALAAGALAAALSCVVGGTTAAHVTIAAIVTVAGVVITFIIQRRRKQHKSTDITSSPDIGHRVKVEKVNDGKARVYYRGTFWDAAGDHEDLTCGIWYIARVDGNRLILRKNK